MLVTRRHSELPAAALQLQPERAPLQLERTQPGDEDRLVVLLERVLPGSLDTDDANVPMQRAFAAVGWHATESRIDLHLP